MVSAPILFIVGLFVVQRVGLFFTQLALYFVGELLVLFLHLTFLVHYLVLYGVNEQILFI